MYSKAFSIFFICSSLISIGLCTTLQSLDTEAGPSVHVSLIYRHGERTPTWRAHNDPYGISYWPEGFGQLTNQGMLHHYQLGQWLRTRYIHLIPHGVFRTRTMCTKSTAYDRTIMSALSSLAGMFPIDKNEEFTNLNWKPIPVHSTSLESDKILAMEKVVCKSYDGEYERFTESDKFKRMNCKYADVYKSLTERIGQPITIPEDLQKIYSTLLIYDMAGLKLPDWSRGLYPQILKEGSDFSFSLPTYTTKLKRLKSGPLLKTIIKTFEEKIDNSKERNNKCSNITSYSAHDDVVANFLNTLGVYNGLSPPFAALIMVELRKSVENKHFVTVLYKNSTDPFADPYLLKIPECDFACPFESFQKILHPVIPIDWDKECNESINGP